MAHRWTKDDEILSLVLYFRRKERSSSDPGFKRLREILVQRGIPASSIHMKLGNYQNLDEGGGLENASQLSRDVWKAYSGDRNKLIAEAARITGESL